MPSASLPWQSLITFAIRLPMHQPSQNHRAPCTSGTRYRAARAKHALAGAYEASGQIGEAVGIRVDIPDQITQAVKGLQWIFEVSFSFN